MKLLKSTAPGFNRKLSQLSRRLALQDVRVERTVREIIKKVRDQGDRAVAAYTARFDRIRVTAGTMRIDPPSIQAAYRQADLAVVESLKLAADRIRVFHERQKTTGWSFRDNGAQLGQRVMPLDRVGLYVPGGKAAYPSSVLMNAIPARVAGVGELVMCSPTPRGEVNPYVLIAADLVGIREIYRIGGAQAIAAMAHGTRTIRPVDKIVGPGNRYVAAAKQLVFGLVDIDMIAGPSEILVIADDSAPVHYLAADLLSQAEHDEVAWTVLVTPSARLVEKVRAELDRQIRTLPTREIATASLKRYGLVILCRDLAEAVEISDAFAPEHLVLSVRDPFKLFERVRHAGSVFLGHETPQALGDYLGGPNHVLPTGGTARFFSPLSVDDFVKRSSFMAFTKGSLAKIREPLTRIARVEGLEAHARAVEVRVQDA